jgi:hypothetical protein
MQQEDRVKMMTGCSDMRRWIRVSVESSRSMDKDDEVEEEEEGEFKLVLIMVER